MNCGLLDKILIDAAEIGAINTVKAAIKDGADINAVANFQTSLLNAVYGGHADIVKILIDSGAKVDNPKLLMAATTRGDIKTMGLLLDAGLDVNAKDLYNYESTAIMYCRDEITAGFLIERGADVNIVKKRDGGTALTFAIIESNFKLVKLLIENGADMFIRIGGQDALQLATTVRDRHPEIIKFLVDEMCRVKAEALS